MAQVTGFLAGDSDCIPGSGSGASPSHCGPLGGEPVHGSFLSLPFLSLSVSLLLKLRKASKQKPASVVTSLGNPFISYLSAVKHKALCLGKRPPTVPSVNFTRACFGSKT